MLSIKILREQELDPNKKYIFGFHPHGIFALSRLCYLRWKFERVSPTEVNPFLSSIHATKPDWYFCA
ncbi:Diacylglycerol acyltransferase [Phytophthora cactorum]|nr:Diacylglycerol acyltransferase [Phytophthora cactorum]